jgi:hypothetical protein
MTLLAALILQAIEPAATPLVAAPDIQLDVRATARRVVVENGGKASLTVTTSVNGREGDSNLVEVEAPELPPGRRELNNAEVRVRAEARISEPLRQEPQRQEPAPQQ